MSQNVACITGAASGIGLALTKHLLGKHWKVIMADMNASQGERLSEELGDDTLFMRVDVSSWEDQAALFKKAFAWGGNRLDFFAANAGIADKQSFYEIAEDAGEDPKPLNTDVMRVDLDAVIQGLRLFMHYARRNQSPGGKCVITSSAAGLYPMDACPLYASAKHAVSHSS